MSNEHQGAAQTREIPMQTRMSPVATVNTEKRTVDLIWSTGAEVTRTDWWTGKRYTEALSMDPAHIRMGRLNSGAPLLNTHNRYELSDVVGVVEKAWLSNGEGMASVRFSEREDVAGVWQDVQSGIVRNVSVGYVVHKYEITKNEDTGVERWLAVDWEPMEISLVPIPADAGAGTRSNDSARLARCEFINLIRGNEMSERENGTTSAPVEERAPAQSTGPTEAEIRAAAVAEERQRSLEIREAVEAARFGSDLADDFIKRGVSADEARRECLRRLAERSESFGSGRSPAPRVEAGRLDEGVTRRDAMADAIFHRVAPAGQLSEAGRQYRYMTMLRLAEESLAAQGVNVRGLPPMEIAARAMHTTSDFANILANVMNKRLRQAYEQSQPTYRIWARRAPNAPDFKAIAVNQLSGAPDLLQVDEHGEFKSGFLSDGKETYQVVTYGRIIPITRQAIVNDDLRAFDRLPMAFGMAANRLENRIVYAQLTANANLSDGVALFHATHGNLAASGSVISVASLGAGRAAMRLQKGYQGEVLNLAPTYLIAPATQEQLAYQYTSTQFVPAKSADVNEFRAGGRTALTPVVEAELDANSTTAWYLASESGLVDTVEYAYLDGAEGVYLETGMEFDIDGMKLKARLDFAAKVIDSRGLYKNPGA